MWGAPIQWDDAPVVPVGPVPPQPLWTPGKQVVLQPARHIHKVYFIYRGTDLLYIGCSNNVRERMYGHKAYSPWFCPETDVVHAIGPYEHYEAYRLEAELIYEHQPRHNIASKKRKAAAA